MRMRQFSYTRLIRALSPGPLGSTRVRLGLILSILITAFLSPASAENEVQRPAWLQQPMTLADARHLLGRTGFGASPDELTALLTLSRGDAIDQIVDAIDTQPYVPMPDWVTAPAPHFWTRQSMSSAEKQAFDAQRDTEIAQLRRWWVSNMLQTHSPQTERLVLFWHDHFATSYDGVSRRSTAIARQNQLFREMATGSYRALLKAMIRDPAMLLYLDNQSNRKGNPNENLARELLELFTLGEGNYSELTVKEAARALTGYGISDTHNLSFRLHGHRRDMEEKTLFGETAIHDGDALIDLILQQPAAAEHLVKKFWHAFISDSLPSASFIDVLSAQFRQSDYDLKHLYFSVLVSEDFWHEDNRLALIKSPANLLIGTARSLDYPKRAWEQIPSMFALLGMNLFAPLNVAGWNEGAAYVVPGRLLNRQLALQSLVSVAGESSDVNQSAITETMNKSMMVTGSMNDNAPAALQVRLAGHFFQGAPKYKVTLHGTDDKQIWESEVHTLEFGHDTETFGEMKDFDQLSWHTVKYEPPAQAIANSVQLKVAFLNDAAGRTGDRNLFVESVSLGSRTISTAGATQESDCPPNNNRKAGYLYCAGTVAVDLTQPLDNSEPRDAAYTATAASVLWVKQKNQELNAIVALENVQTPDRHFHTVSFYLFSRNAQELEVTINAYSCWPDCFEVWPECAWLDERSQEKSMMFPLRRGQNQQVDCHYESVSLSEQALVKAIYASMPSLAELLSASAKNTQEQTIAQGWTDRIKGLRKRLETSDYATEAKPFIINSRFAIPAVAYDDLAEPRIESKNIIEFARLAEEAELSLAEMLIGGVSPEQFPDLKNDPNAPIEDQLEKLMTHPVFQVY